MTEPLQVLHVVRRYGPVGGMEGYVWQLTRELADMGHRVEVLCEKLYAQVALDGITVHALGDVRPKPRWLSHVKFSRLALQWLEAHPDNRRIVHSHERIGNHHITTFHGPPFRSVMARPWYRRMSLRILAQLWLEKREVCAPQVRFVVPVSTLIQESLDALYPCIADRMANPIVPGVANIPARPPRTVSKTSGVVGFVGKEWKRKGLDLAVAIVKFMRETRPDLEFRVAGPPPELIRHLFTDWQGGYRLLGEVDARPLFAEFDLLLHPARKEPFGMVITEALSAGVPTVISDQCGARSEVLNGRVLPVSTPIRQWAQCCLDSLGKPQGKYSRTWREVAEDYLVLYRQLS